MESTQQLHKCQRQCARVCIPVPWVGFDPTEVAVPYKILAEAGVDVTFATPDSVPESVLAAKKKPNVDSENDTNAVGAAGYSAAADPIMLTGKGLYLLKWSMRADPIGLAAYNEALVPSGVLDNSVTFSSLQVEDYDALLLPGGHCPDMRPYLEDTTLQAFVKKFAETGKTIGAVCHGVVLAGRSGILQGKTVTALPGWMESLAFNSTRLWMGAYYKTYAKTSVEKEVTEFANIYQRGPLGLKRDAPVHGSAKQGSLVKTINTFSKVDGKPSPAETSVALGLMAKKSGGFVVEDGQLLTARWPGDCHSLGYRLLAKLVLQGHAVKPASGVSE